MYTVLAVDDEKPILDTLRSSVSWQQFGVDIFLTAMDGASALEIMRAQRVDLLITDIRMPQMNGLELLTRVRAMNSAAHCILLTAYGEFEYAREAIRLGVENYLLKPFNKDELEETIEKALDNIYANRESSASLFSDNILLRWIDRAISGEELSERCALLNINIYLPRYRVVCVKCKQPDAALRAYCAAVAEALAARYEAHLLWDQKGHHVFIIGGESLPADDIIGIFTGAAGWRHVEPAIALSIGDLASGCTDVPFSYESACRRLDAADWAGGGPVILRGDSPAAPGNEALSALLLDIFHAGDVAREGLRLKLTDNLLRQAGMGYDGLFQGISQEIARLFRQEFPVEAAVHEQLADRMHTPVAMEGKDTFIAAVADILDYSYLLYQYALDGLSPIIRHAVGYIHEHFAQGVSIKEYCGKNRISIPYFGYLFKKETGMFFNNYLSQYRVCNAIALLRETDEKIGDIAQKTGFASASYFITHFKKKTGLSPNKYRAVLADEDAV